MPKLYEYFGISILFYANEHLPIHVHGKHGNSESRAEFEIEEGRIVAIHFIREVPGKSPLSARHYRYFQEAVNHFAEEIVQAWIDYFVYRKHRKTQKVTKRIR